MFVYNVAFLLVLLHVGITAAFLGILRTVDLYHGDDDGNQGKSQSPININTKTVKVAQLPPLKFEFDSIGPLLLKSTGHSLQLEAPESKHFLKGGPLNGAYQFQQLHFHWGTKNSRGSEHTINKKSYPIEMHAVYKRIDTENDLAVVGYVFQINRDRNISLKKMLDVAVDATKFADTYKEVQPFPLQQLVVPFRHNYYTYNGSLTTPPYSENVVWILPNDLYPISQNQLKTFRSCAAIEESMKNNYRKVQPLNGRVVRMVVKNST